MNRRQVRVLSIALAIIILMILFPPFHVIYAPGVIIDKGFHFILTPPSFQDRILATLDMNALLIQIIVVLALASMHLYVVRDKHKN
jgi:hypothetical protein